MACVSSEESERPGHPPGLISLRCPHDIKLGPLLSIERRAKTLFRLPKADLRLRWAHVSFCRFCHTVAHFVFRETDKVGFDDNLARDNFPCLHKSMAVLTSTHNVFLWRIGENYPLLIIINPLYLAL